MGHKSKFTFPMPHRKPKEPPTISAPLTKVQKILGTGGINIDSLTVPNSNSRPWDTRSTGGISIAVSESSASQATNGHGYGHGYGNVEEAGNRSDNAERNYGHLAWEQESAIIPRILRHAHSSNDRGLSAKKSTSALSADYLDVTTDASSVRRQQSSSTINSHYEKASVPLSVSQQTSNSAIARGLPPKAKALLDVEGVHPNRTDSKKKKPPRLDLLMLTGRHRKQQRQRQQRQRQGQEHELNSLVAEPVLGNNYVMRSPSLVSPKWNESVEYLNATHYSPKRGTKLFPIDATAPSLSSVGPNRLRASSDTTHQLYDHYEQMLARHESSLDLEQSESPIESTICGGSSPISSPPFFAPLAAPSRPVVKKRSENWTHTRKPSKESEISSFGGLAAAMHPMDHIATKMDYASSISSRYTRTSKASRTDKSLLESDRQITSVLSLSDSDSDDDAVLSVTKSSPFSQRSLREEPRTATPNHRPSSVRQLASESRASNQSQVAGHAPLNDYLAIPLTTQATPKPENNRVHSSNSIRSSTSTVLPLPAAPLEPSCFPDRSTRASDTSSLGSRLRDSDFTLHEAKAIKIRPPVSTVEAPSWVSSADTGSSQHHRATPPQRPGTRTSHYSRNSEQPTPPLSPLSSKSVEIYLQSPEPAREDPESISGSSEPNKSRFIAVTKQEEMLLAALRNKRAMMRENIIAELDAEDRGSGGDMRHGEASNSVRSGKGPSASPPTQNAVSRLEVPGGGHGPKQPPRPVPKRRSSLLRGTVDGGSGSGSTGQRLTQEQIRTLRNAGTAAPRPRTAGERSASSSQASGSTGSRGRLKAPRDRVLMYLERPPALQQNVSNSTSGLGLDSSSLASGAGDSGEEEYHRHGRGQEQRHQREEDRPRSRANSSNSSVRRHERESIAERRDDDLRRRLQPRRLEPEPEPEPQPEPAPESEQQRQLPPRPGSAFQGGRQTPATPARQLQRVPEDDRETDDDPDGDSEDDDDESEIDFDAFPTPAAYSSVFGMAAQTWKQGGKEKEKEKEKEAARSISPPLAQQQQQRSDTPTTGTPGSGHIKGKKSGVRLSAVGGKNLLLPWAGDDD